MKFWEKCLVVVKSIAYLCEAKNEIEFIEKVFESDRRDDASAFLFVGRAITK